MFFPLFLKPEPKIFHSNPLIDRDAVLPCRPPTKDPAEFHPFEPGAVNDRKHAWIERAGAECTALDIPFFLELVGYEDFCYLSAPAEEQSSICTGEHRA